MVDILDLHHEDLDYEEDLEEGSPPAKKVCLGCPVEGCKFDPGRSSLEQHWHNVHQKEVLLLYCPLLRCGFRACALDRLHKHLGGRHRLTAAQCPTVMALPVVAEMKKNLSYRDPGDVAAPVSPEAVPVDAIQPCEKKTLEGLVESAIREAALPVPVPTVLVVPIPPVSVPVVVPLMSLPLEEPTHRRTVVISGEPATVSKPPPSPEKSQPLVDPPLEATRSLIAPFPGDLRPPVSSSPGPSPFLVYPCPEDYQLPDASTPGTRQSPVEPASREPPISTLSEALPAVEASRSPPITDSVPAPVLSSSSPEHQGSVPRVSCPEALPRVTANHTKSSSHWRRDWCRMAACGGPIRWSGSMVE